MPNVSEVMAKLASKFQPEAAKDLDVVYQINITDHSPYQLVIKEQQCTVVEGENPDPNITLLMDVDTFEDIVNGTIGGTTAYMTGRLQAEGNVILATKLSKLFKR